MAYHLAYEVEMLIVSGTLALMPVKPVDELSRDKAHVDHLVRRNSYLEAFAIHARLLRDVFCNTKPWPDDVVAGQFLPAGAVWDATEPPELARVNWRTGKEVAHLTWHRLDVDPADRPWAVYPILTALMRLVQRFLAAADPLALGPYKERIEHLLWFSRTELSVRRLAWVLTFPEQASPSTATSFSAVAIGGKVVELERPPGSARAEDGAS